SKLNTMLSGLLSSAEESETGRAIKKQFDDTFSDAESAFQNVIEGCGRAARTVEEMRGISGIDGEAHWEFALWELVEEAQKRVESDIGTGVCSNVGWESHIDRSAPDRVEGNPFVLIQAVANLLENAIQYSEGASPVRVELPENPARDKSVVDFVIRNQSAIAPEHHERIFQMGFSTAGRRGTGLNVARSMLREQGGKLELIDDGRETGWVSFKVTLPTVTAELGHAA
ncbi:MAG: HAMP domain-containing sensor histidine kinase, partial [Myxococcota bacterium]|nr:HAMP domain-containing sensor histidine kinase [Myxococcota bacterium]